MRSITVPIKFPADLKHKLDGLKKQGYTIAGFVRRAVTRELANHHRTQKG
ncbi:MAG: hypothetical protein OJF51_004872 [Nitrospira sp.]|jgi:hypothetical protein|nr:MAG: hypothetical protein OJF51_004872 [Nitrospira sp.]